MREISIMAILYVIFVVVLIVAAVACRAYYLGWEDGYNANKGENVELKKITAFICQYRQGRYTENEVARMVDRIMGEEE